MMAGKQRSGSRRRGPFSGVLRRWESFWMFFAGTSLPGRMATRIAGLFTPPYMARFHLARCGPRGYVDPTAIICHGLLNLAPKSFIADRVIIYQAEGGGSVTIATRAHVLRDSVLETGDGGQISIGEDTMLHPRAQVMAYKGDIRIGAHATIAPNCAFYAYNHSFVPGELIKKQPLVTKGGIRIEDGVWLGYGVIVLDGVTIGEGALVGAGSVVTHDIPPNAIVAGSPTKILQMR